jgi:GTPase
LPGESEDSPLESAQKILRELQRYDDSLYGKPRWLVLNKTDLMAPDEARAVADEITRGLDWSGPVYNISAIKGEGVEALCQDIMNFLEQHESL